MVDTRYLTAEVEDHVRGDLAAKYKVNFSKQRLRLQTGGMHEFDAVSADGRIVASVKAASGKTSGGRHPSGKVMSSIAELYYLSIVTAPIRLLVLTSPDFHEIFTRVMRDKVVPGVDIVHIPLPPDMQRQVKALQKAAGDELVPVLDKAEESDLP